MAGLILCSCKRHDHCLYLKFVAIHVGVKWIWWSFVIIENWSFLVCIENSMQYSMHLPCTFMQKGFCGGGVHWEWCQSTLFHHLLCTEWAAVGVPTFYFTTVHFQSHSLNVNSNGYTHSANITKIVFLFIWMLKESDAGPIFLIDCFAENELLWAVATPSLSLTHKNWRLLTRALQKCELRCFGDDLPRASASFS